MLIYFWSYFFWSLYLVVSVKRKKGEKKQQKNVSALQVVNCSRYFHATLYKEKVTSDCLQNTRSITVDKFWSYISLNLWAVSSSFCQKFTFLIWNSFHETLDNYRISSYVMQSTNAIFLLYIFSRVTPYELRRLQFL